MPVWLLLLRIDRIYVSLQCQVINAWFTPWNLTKCFFQNSCINWVVLWTTLIWICYDLLFTMFLLILLQLYSVSHCYRIIRLPCSIGPSFVIVYAIWITHSMLAVTDFQRLILLTQLATGFEALVWMNHELWRYECLRYGSQTSRVMIWYLICILIRINHLQWSACAIAGSTFTDRHSRELGHE